MKVIFLEDILNIARAGEIKEVANGYGRNFLIPRKLALLAKPQAMKTIEAQIKDRTSIAAKTETEMIMLANQLHGKEITMKAHVGQNERLYGSIMPADIAAELENTAGSIIDKRKIELDEPIRRLGSYEVTIKLAKDIIPKITVTVIED